MALSETSICNMALASIGAERINIAEGLGDSESLSAIQCREHYEQTRDALLRSHTWAFAAGRKILSQDDTDPVFEWDNQFILPTDFLRVNSLFDTIIRIDTFFSYSIERELLLTNELAVNLRYTRRITDPTKFDNMFVEVLVLTLAIKLVMPLARDFKLAVVLEERLLGVMARARLVNKVETNTTKADLNPTWLEGRLTVRNQAPFEV